VGEAVVTGARRGFTLIELLVVIAVVAVLIGLAVPALSRARESGRRVVCLSNLRSFGQAFRMYADGNKDRLPHTLNAADVTTGLLEPFLTLSAHLDAPLPTVDAAGAVTTRPPYRCPSDTKTAPVRGFTYRYAMLDYFQAMGGSDPGLTLGRFIEGQPAEPLLIELWAHWEVPKGSGFASGNVLRVDGAAERGRFPEKR